MYKLYLDKQENFECEISVKNASLKGSMARLVVESSDGLNLVFKGKLDGERCIIPIKRLKGILEENTRGKIHLEVIVEDTYFKPWESDFLVEEHTSVKVKVNEQKQYSNKPIIKVRVPISKNNFKPKKENVINIFIPKKEIAMICEQFGIKKYNLNKKRNEFFQILKEYFKLNPEYNYHVKSILMGITDLLN